MQKMQDKAMAIRAIREFCIFRIFWFLFAVEAENDLDEWMRITQPHIIFIVNNFTILRSRSEFRILSSEFCLTI